MSDLITKLISDIHINLSIKKASLGSTEANTIMAVKGQDDSMSLKLYYAAEDVAADFGADSNASKKAEFAFSQDNFMGPLGILVYPNADQEIAVENPVTTYSTVSTPTADGANVELKSNTATTQKVPGIIAGLQNYLWSGWRYLILDTDDDVETIKSIAHYLYANQHGILVSSVKSIDNLKAIHDEAVAMVKPDHLGNTIGIVNKNEDEYPDIAAAIFATNHIPLDWMHIRNLNGVTANEWSYAEYQQIADLNGITTVNKSGDIMLSAPKALDGSYIDNTFGTQYVYDELQKGLQKFMNSRDLLTFDDDGINLLAANADGVMQSIAKTGVIAKGSDGKPIMKVDKDSRANTSNVDVANRRYRGLRVTCQLVGSIETIDMSLSVTL